MKVPVNLLKRSRIPALCIMLVLASMLIAMFSNQSAFADYFFSQPLSWCALVILVIAVLVNLDDYYHERNRH